MKKKIKVKMARKWNTLTFILMVLSINSVTGQQAVEQETIKVLKVEYGSASIGNIYDGTKDKLILGYNLFEDLEITRVNQTNVKTDFTADESILDRTNTIGVSASLKLSFMGGLIQVSGSANYLHNEIRSEDIASLTYFYQRTSHLEVIKGGESKVNPKVCALDTGATHFVSGVQYGFDAYLTFEKKVTNTDSKREVSGSLQAAIKAVPAFQIEGKVELNLTETEKIKNKDLTYSFSGNADIVPPTTYEEAVLLTKQMPDHAKKNNQVVSFTISPIKDYCEESTKILNAISNRYINDVSAMVKDFEDIRREINTIQDRRFARQFGVRYGILDVLAREYKLAELNIQGELKTILPKVRGTSEGEGDLVQLLENYTASWYNKKRLVNFLKTRKKEIATIERVIYDEDIKKLQETGIVALDLDDNADAAGCTIDFNFNLKFSIAILPGDSTEFIENFKTTNNWDEKHKWFYSPETLGKLTPLKMTLIDFANENKNSKDTCIIIELKELDASNSVPFKLEMLRYGKSLTDEFKLPAKIESIVEFRRGVNDYTLNITHEKIPEDGPFDTFMDLTFTSINAQPQAPSKNQSDQWKPEILKEEDVEMERGATSTLVQISDLAINTLYSVKIIVKFKHDNMDVGIGPVSDLPFIAWTLPSSPPHDLKCEPETEHKIKFDWQKPLQVAPGVDVNNFEYTLKKCSQACDKDKTSTTNQFLQEFDGLIPETQYSLSVKYLGKTANEFPFEGEKFYAKMESYDATVSCTTLPERPSEITMITIEHATAGIRWEAYKNEENETHFLHYKIKLYPLQTPDQSIEIVSKKNEKNLTGLSPDTGYKVAVKIVTVLGSSLFSDDHVFQTKQLSEHDQDRVLRLEMQIEDLKMEVQTMSSNVEDNILASLNELKNTTEARIEANIKMIDENSGRIDQNEIKTINNDAEIQARTNRVRIRGGATERDGYVEVLASDGRWGGVCDDTFDGNDGHVPADVVCRMLGYPSAENYTRESSLGYGASLGNFALDTVKCTGDESSLFDCKHDDEWKDNCGVKEWVGVKCAEGQARLRGGSVAWEGYIELKSSNGTWGGVCDDDFKLPEADVVCHMLGYPAAEKYFVESKPFGWGASGGDFVLDEVDCTGDEHSLFDCSHNGEWKDDCATGEWAGVRCKQWKDYASRIKLTNRTRTSEGTIEGRIEVKASSEDNDSSNRWGGICDDEFDMNDANVVCRMLGYPSASAFFKNSHFGYGESDEHLVLDQLKCVGNEESVFDCASDGEWEENCGNTEWTGVRCNLWI